MDQEVEKMSKMGAMETENLAKNSLQGRTALDSRDWKSDKEQPTEDSTELYEYVLGSMNPWRGLKG